MATLTFTAPDDKPILSQEQLDAFKRDGFLIVENFLTEEEAAALPTMSDDLESMPDVRGSLWKYWNMQKPVAGEEKGARFLDRLEYFVDFHEGWKNLFLAPTSKLVRATTELFGGDEAILWKEKLNFKKPGSSGFTPHQDAQAGWLEHNQTIHISVAVNIDETTIENGCLEMVRGKHANGLLGGVREEMPKEVVESMDWESVPAKPTTVIFFDSFVPHRSEPNKTQKDRRVCLSTYAKKSESDFYPRKTYFDDKLKMAPPDVYKDEGVAYRGYLI
jgi:ectoine hydroxylase-related dioxygenase (phytanoyl-CoA dioxygenase family)